MNKHFDAVILGGGVSGLMAARRIGSEFRDMSIAIIDLGARRPDHSFHLHRYINDIPGLDETSRGPMYKFVMSVWDGKQCKTSASIQDVNRYGLKIFDSGELKVSNIQNISSYPVLPIDISQLENTLKCGVNFTQITGVVVVVSKENHTVDVVYSVEDPPEAISYDYLISTIPLPALLSISGVNHDIKFTSYPFYVGTHRLGYHSSCYQVLMNTDEGCNVTRVVLMDDTMFIESVSSEMTYLDYKVLENTFGLRLQDKNVEMNIVRPGRIDPLPRQTRKPLLHWLTEKHDIFTLGRYGAWTYKVANDVWDDTAFLTRLIYAKHQAKIYERRSP